MDFAKQIVMTISYKISIILSGLIGFMSIFAGSRVLLGFDTKNYTVLNWLVTYNVLFGFISIVVAYLIWRNNFFIKKAVLFILASHTFLALYLSFFSETVALESIKAMGFRISIWIVIYFLIYKKTSNTKN